MNITFRQLQIFEAVAQHLSYTRASEALHLTQPAVSMQIKQLEQSVGLPLFEQLGKKVFHTEAGHEFNRYAKVITTQLDELEQVVNEMKGLQRGHLTIAVASTANYFAPRLLATFHQQHGEITVSLDVTNREQLLKSLVENRADLVIMGQPPAEMDLVVVRFMDNPLVVIAPPSHPLVSRRKIPPRAYENHAGALCGLAALPVPMPAAVIKATPFAADSFQNQAGRLNLSLRHA